CGCGRVMPKAYVTRRHSRPFSKANDAHGEPRLKEWWLTRRFMRSLGDLPLKTSAFQFDSGTEKKTAHSRCNWRRNWQTVSRIVNRALLRTPAIIRCRSAICRKSLKI